MRRPVLILAALAALFTAAAPVQALTPAQRPAVLSGGGYDPATIRLVAAISPRPSPTWVGAANTFIRSLKATGVWGRLDALWVFAGPTGSTLLNWKNPGSLTLTAGGSPTLAVNKGYAFNGTTDYFNTGFTIGSSGTATAGDVSVGIWALSNVANTVATDVGAVGSPGSGGSLFIAVTRSGANQYFAQLNLTSSTGTTFGTVTDSTGYTVFTRSGTSVRAAKNGVDNLASFTPGAAVAPDTPLYIGARNNVGTAERFDTRSLALIHLGPSLTAAQISAFYTAFQAYQLAINPYVYVSAVSVNGIPVGDDTTGDGSITAPFLTIDKGVTAVQTGQTILLNGDPASPTDYRSATAINVTKSLSIDCVVANCASISAATTTGAVIRTSVTTPLSLTLGRITIDCRNLNLYGVQTSATPTAVYSVTLNGTKIVNPTTYGVSDASSYADIVWRGGTFSCTDCREPIAAYSKLGGGVQVEGGSFTTTHVSGAFATVADVQAFATGVRTRITGVTSSGSLFAGANTGTYVYGVRTQNIDGAVITDSNFTCDTTAAGASIGCKLIYITATPNVSALPSGDCTIARNTVYAETVSGASGMAIEIGEDGYVSFVDGMVNGCKIYQNDVSAGPNAQAAAFHGIFNGNRGNSLIYRNYIHDIGVGAGDKRGSGAIFYSNIVKNCRSSCLVMKGSLSASMIHNTVILTAANASVPALFQEVNPETSENSVNATWIGNIFYADGLSTPLLAKIDANQTVASIGYNDYFGSLGVASGSFQFGGVSYASVAAWAAASGESTALGVDPLFTNAAGGVYSLQAGSPLKNVSPYNANAPVDYSGAAFAQPNASVGAYQ